MSNPLSHTNASAKPAKSDDDAARSDMLTRIDGMMVFDVVNGNPNGDPDHDNAPRKDVLSGHGYITDVCLKRKIRNWLLLTGKNMQKNMEISIQERAVLNRLYEAAYRDLDIDLTAPPKAKEDGTVRKKAGVAQGSEIDRARALMCERYFDVRTFGAVMSTGPNAGQVMGPINMGFADSVEPITIIEDAITRMAIASEKEEIDQGGANRTFGRKCHIPYATYVAPLFLNPFYAQKCGFGKADWELFLEAMNSMFEFDRSAARGVMTLRAVILFDHGNQLGAGASAGQLFDHVKIERVHPDDVKPARRWGDYRLTVKGMELDPDRVIHTFGVSREAGRLVLTPKDQPRAQAA